MDSGERRILSLTRREKEIVTQIARGSNNAEIADHLGIAEKTVRNHLTVIYSKLQLTSRLELAIYAAQHRLQ